MILWILLVFGLLATVKTQKAKDSKFSCDGRGSGYYADVSTGCQVYHMCDGLGRQFSYSCPNATLFQQRMLICDHWYMVNCSRAEDDYSANLLIGQKKPFVEDSESNPFQRTPRPDLLSHPSSESEYNIIYRTGREHGKSRTNIVGIDESANSGNPDEPTYFPPTHWSTAYPSQTSTAKPAREDGGNRRILNQGSSYRTNNSQGKKTRAKPKAIDFSSSNRNRNNNNFDSSPRQKNNDAKNTPVPTPIPINYKSNFKATTPVFPLTVEESSETPNDIGILPPIPYRNTKTKGTPSQSDPRPVNFASNFEATTPVFPLTVDDNSAASNNIGILPPIQKPETETRRPQVNFQSDFKATTPVFPLTVEEGSEAPHDLGILPPLSGQDSGPKKTVTTDEAAPPQVNFKSDFQATTPVFPLTVEASSVAPSDLGILPPDPKDKKTSDEPQVNFQSNFKATTPVFPVTGDDSSVAPSDIGISPPELDQTVNFKSNFKATTPVYPEFVEPKNNTEILDVPLLKETHVNYYSDFKATTPVYPQSVEPTSPDPNEAGLLPPQASNNTIHEEHENAPVEIPDLLLSLTPPEVDTDFEKTHEGIEITPSEPSMFYQAPKFEPDYTSPETKTKVRLGIEIENIMKSLTREQWQNIRQRLHIPEYEFPLDDATRPSYDSIANSFRDKR